MSAQNDARRNWNGSRWITPSRRLAIYLRDGMACVYCTRAIESDEGVTLSLDHIRCEIYGGTHVSTNLVTACTLCNSRRGKKSVREFSQVVVGFHGQERVGTPEQIESRVRNFSRRKVRTEDARAIIARRKAERED